MVNLTTYELGLTAGKRGIKNYKNMSKEGLSIALLKSEQSRAKHYNKVEKNKEYFDQYDPDYEGVWNMKDLFDEINEGYCQPVITRSAFKVSTYNTKLEGTNKNIYHPKNILT